MNTATAHTLACLALYDARLDGCADRIAYWAAEVARLEAVYAAELRAEREAPTAFNAAVQWKDSDDAPATVTIALTDDPGEDADGDDSVFYYAGRMTEAEARAAFSRDASPEEWYIA